MVKQAINFDHPYQYKQVAAYDHAIVFEILCPGGFVGYIKYTANNWFPNTHIQWLIDGELLEDLQRQIAPINSPRKEEPSIIFKKRVQFVAYNQDSVAHYFECLQDGVFISNK